VYIAENRANRPNEYDVNAMPPPPGEAASTSGRSRAVTSCPFCPGNETKTPSARYEQLDDERRWRLRVIPNKYPVVTETPGSASGIHEVIIETARHVERTSSLSELELRNVLKAYAECLRTWRTNDRLAYGLVFKNQGPRAGATIAHLHSQFFALPAVPPAVDAELRRAKDEQLKQGSCVYCNLIQQERAAALRVVHDGDGYFAFCPFVSLQPCEVWLMPLSHEPSYELSMSDSALDRLAKILRRLVIGVESLTPSASFNWLFRTAPWNADGEACFHWRIELLPRVNAIAGFESATGIYINPVPPERAAAELRRRGP
jgi:UDPglucose--hexose-1-phosphate uridylyltransferase